MRLSQFFFPTLKADPADASIKSHRLMLRAGMIRSSSAAGMVVWLPYGQKILARVEEVVRDQMDRAGCLEVTLPMIQDEALWEQSGRNEDYGKELLRIQDRHNRKMIFSPTAEELITDMMSKELSSYKDFPRTLYQIHWKFRDEIRPRFGVLRGREFLMKDAYSFDLNYESARKTYDAMLVAYTRIFHALGIRALPFQADPGEIGGELSHEFIILSHTGESEVFLDKQVLHALDAIYQAMDQGVCSSQLVNPIKALTSDYYAHTDELHDPIAYDRLEEKNKLCMRGIEVAHIFYLGTKYSKSFDYLIQDSTNERISPHMGCYGIGVSRIVGALVESCSTEEGFVWPKEVAPYLLHLISPNNKDPETKAKVQNLYEQAVQAGIAVAWDDRPQSFGSQMRDADLLGAPYRIVAGKKLLTQGSLELIQRSLVNNQIEEKCSELDITEFSSFLSSLSRSG